MPRVFTRTIEIPPEVIDVNGHVNNLAYLQWMQEAAIAHSAAQGWPVERYLEAGAVWVVRSHSIEYLAPAFKGDVLTLLTWVTGFKRFRSPRRYLFWRERDGVVIARAETLWVFVHASSGRPTAIPPELQQAFLLVPPEEDVLETFLHASRAERGGAGQV